MSKQLVANSNVYKDRFEQYGKIYSDAWPEPPPMPAPASSSNSALGAQKTALVRKQRYNDKSTTQSMKP